jgi:hypothetical protein
MSQQSNKLQKVVNDVWPFVVLLALGCNPSFAKPCGTETAVSKALAMSRKD